MSVKELVFQNKIFAEKIIGRRVKIVLANDANNERWIEPREKWLFNGVTRDIGIKQGELGTLVAVDTYRPDARSQKHVTQYAVIPDHYIDDDGKAETDYYEHTNTQHLSVWITPPDNIQVISGGKAPL